MKNATPSQSTLWCCLALALIGATASNAHGPNLPGQSSIKAGLNVPPQDLLHPEQFGIEDMGYRSATAVVESFADEAAPASTAKPDRTATINVQARAVQMPTAITNGNFGNLGAGWQGFMQGGFYFADFNGPTLAMNIGYPAPAGAPTLRGDAFNISNTPRCAGRGEMWQDIRVKPGARLRFHWMPAYTQPTFGIEGTLGLSINDPYTSRQIWNVQPLNYAAIVNARSSEIDLSAYAGLDVRVVFASEPRPDSIARTCYNTTWFDNVEVVQGAINYQNAQPTPGIWYNPHRAGTGWDLRAMPGGGFYGIWYTFQGGQPTWYYLDPAQMVNGSFDTNIRKMVRTGTSVQQTIVGRVNLRMLGTTSGLMSFDFFDYPNASGAAWDNTEHFQLLTAGGANAYNGFWHPADASDPNWGLTTLSYGGGNLFSTQYFYDSTGQPIWTLAQGAFSGSGQLVVKRAVGGLCPNCAGSYPSVVHQNVGTLSMTFPYPSSNTMTATFSAGQWQRSLRTYYKLTH